MILSIVIPVYNAEKYLDECIKSVCSTVNQEIEVVLIDDGSTDASPELCDKWSKMDQRVRVLHIANGGVSNARNVGIQNCQADRVMFLDADDYIDVEKWDFILQSVQENNSDFIAFAYKTLFDNGQTKDELFEFEKREASSIETARKIMFASSRLNACWAKIYKKDLIEKYQLYFEKGVAIGEDTTFVTEYFCRCETYHFYNEMILFYRQHDASAMKHYGIKERLNYTYPLYELSKKKLKDISDEELKKEVAVYYFRVLTNLYREYAQREKGKELSETYKILLQDAWAQEVIRKVSNVQLPKLKMVEYRMIRGGAIGVLKSYFGLKARFM